MNVEQLVAALEADRQPRPDSLTCALTHPEWIALAPFMAVRYLRPGDPLIHEGDADREVFFLAEGELEVTLKKTPLAVLQPGSVVGEGTFFSGQPRGATVTPLQPGIAWCLRWERFNDLSKKNPALALNLTKGLAAILAIRMREALLIGHFM